jgi:hypothetical protein
MVAGSTAWYLLHVSVLLCLAITLVRISSITDRLSPSCTHYHTSLQPNPINPIGWHYITETFHCPPIPYINSKLGLQAFFWILVPWGWDRYVVPKRRQEIITACCVITQKSEVLSYFAVEAWHHALLHVTLQAPRIFEMAYKFWENLCTHV